MKELPNTVVHVPTKKEYNELMEMYEKAGWVWFSGNKPTKIDRWSIDKKDTCFRVENYFVCSEKDYYEDVGYTILTLEQFKKEQENTMRYKVGDISVSKFDTEQKVLAICGDVYLMSWFDDFGGGSTFFTEKGLNGGDYKLKDDKPEEMTVAEIEEELGRKIKIKKG